MNALALLLTPSISSNTPFLINGLLWRGEGGPKRANENKQGEGRNQTYLYAHSVKNCLIFQTANKVLSNKLLGSC